MELISDRRFQFTKSNRVCSCSSFCVQSINSFRSGLMHTKKCMQLQQLPPPTRICVLQLQIRRRWTLPCSMWVPIRAKVGRLLISVLQTWGAKIKMPTPTKFSSWIFGFWLWLGWLNLKGMTSKKNIVRVQTIYYSAKPLGPIACTTRAHIHPFIREALKYVESPDQDI